MKLSDITNSPLCSDHRLRWLVIMFLVALSLAGISNYAYYRCPLENAGVDEFTKELHRREAVANTMLDYVVENVTRNGLNSVMLDKKLYDDSEKNNIAIFIVKRDSFLSAFLQHYPQLLLCWGAAGRCAVPLCGFCQVQAEVFCGPFPRLESFCQRVQSADEHPDCRPLYTGCGRG